MTIDWLASNKRHIWDKDKGQVAVEVLNWVDVIENIHEGYKTGDE